jgi:hypothetical protein
MKVIIIEDERLIAKNLQMQLKKIAPEFEVIAHIGISGRFSKMVTRERTSRSFFHGYPIE